MLESPADMSDLARRIREARESLGVSIEDAERATKIRRRFIEAIEAGDFLRLPDGPPSRGFIRNYARYLGLDPDQSLVDFEAEVGVPISQIGEEVPPPPTRQQQVSQYTQLVKLPQVRWKGDLPPSEQTDLDTLADTAEGPPDGSRANGNGRTVFRRAVAPAQSSSFSLRAPAVTATSDVRPFTLGRSAFNLRSSTGGADNTAALNRIPSISDSNRSGLWRALMVAGAGVAGLVAVVALVALVLLPAARATQQAAAPEATQNITVSILGETTPQPAATLPAIAQDTAVAPASTDAPPAEAPTAAPVVQPAPGGGVVLTLDARERAWVRVRADGNVIYTGIPPIGPNSTWRGQGTIGIETGNAGAFDVIINNVRLGAPGARNATVNITWDATGQVVQN